MATVYMKTVPKKPKLRVLTKALYCITRHGIQDNVPVDFVSDGSSSGFLSPVFPRHRHPVAYFRHDYRCKMALNKGDRKFADKEFERDVGKTSWWITKKAGYLGVRVGAFFGIGSSF